jgi:hypothetical protein
MFLTHWLLNHPSVVTCALESSPRSEKGKQFLSMKLKLSPCRRGLCGTVHKLECAADPTSQTSFTNASVLKFMPNINHFKWQERHFMKHVICRCTKLACLFLNYMELSLCLKSNIRLRKSRKSMPFKENEGSLRYSEQPTADSCWEPDESTAFDLTALRSILILYLLLRLGLQSGPFSVAFATKLSYLVFIVLMRSTCPADCIPLDSIVQLIFGEDYKLCRSS